MARWRDALVFKKRVGLGSKTFLGFHGHVVDEPDPLGRACGYLGWTAVVTPSHGAVKWCVRGSPLLVYLRVLGLPFIPLGCIFRAH